VTGDAFFPEFDEREWELVSQSFHSADERHSYAFTLQCYERRDLARDPG
jgi:dihydrofolate reductase